jgi:hypothetical protein
MSPGELFALLVLCLSGWFWLDSIKVRELGVKAARDACQREGVQLLDDTVSIRSVRLGRNDDGRVCLRRVYDFEFSGSGDDRQRGSVILLGTEVEMLDVGIRHPPTFTVH